MKQTKVALKVKDCVVGVVYSCDAMPEFWRDGDQFFWRTNKGFTREFYPALEMEVDEAYAVQMWN